jgi:hypothetical protein
MEEIKERTGTKFKVTITETRINRKYIPEKDAEFVFNPSIRKKPQYLIVSLNCGMLL